MHTQPTDLTRPTSLTAAERCAALIVATLYADWEDRLRWAWLSGDPLSVGAILLGCADRQEDVIRFIRTFHPVS